MSELEFIEQLFRMWRETPEDEAVKRGLNMLKCYEDARAPSVEVVRTVMIGELRREYRH